MEPAAPQAAQDAVEIAPSTPRQLEPQRDFRTREAGKIRRFFQDAIKARRGDFKPVIIDVLDGEHAREVIADEGAILDVDTAGLFRLVDEDTQQTASRALLDVDQLETQPGHRFFDQYG